LLEQAAQVRAGPVAVRPAVPDLAHVDPAERHALARRRDAVELAQVRARPFDSPGGPVASTIGSTARSSMSGNAARNVAMSSRNPSIPGAVGNGPCSS